jgi:hypothetical protein
MNTRSSHPALRGLLLALVATACAAPSAKEYPSAQDAVDSLIVALRAHDMDGARSILGTGADSALNRGITRFFRDYPYSKIGFRCVLTNDQFSVNGTIHEGGTEYLVRRGFLRGVDVVNRNPENVISFKDMQERVGRLARSPQTEPIGVDVH